MVKLMLKQSISLVWRNQTKSFAKIDSQNPPAPVILQSDTEISAILRARGPAAGGPAACTASAPDFRFKIIIIPSINYCNFIETQLLGHPIKNKILQKYNLQNWRPLLSRGSETKLCSVLCNFFALKWPQPLDKEYIYIYIPPSGIWKLRYTSER